MAHWDVFHGDRLETERSLTTEAVLAALASGALVEDDLVRPAGETRWARLGDAPEFADPGPTATIAPTPVPTKPAPAATEAAFSPMDDEEDDSDESDLTRFEPDSMISIGGDALGGPTFEAFTEFEVVPASDPGPTADGPPSSVDALPISPEFDPPSVDALPVPSVDKPPAADRVPSSVDALPVLPDDEAQAPDLPELDDDGIDLIDEDEDEDEDEEAAEFTLSRASADRVEELDLAAMVDVAFQLVLFFLVTASTVVFKTLEVPRPNEEKPPEAAAQARTKSIDELEADFILVEVDAEGAIKVDRQPVPADRPALTEKLRAARQSTGRKGMLLSAAYATRHKAAVLVFDVAEEIDLKVAIAQPAATGANAKK